MRTKAEAFSKTLKKRLAKRSLCRMCGSGSMGGGRHSDRLELHHYLPVCGGGASTADNAVLLCLSCHVAVHEGRIESPRPYAVRA